MRYLSLFSGIEAATVAWRALGWQPVAFSEIEPFCNTLLAHHYPDVPNLGDVEQITDDQIRALGPIDLVVFGFPCQDVSVAGERKGLTHDGKPTRSGLFFHATRIVRVARPRWFVAENVPGLFSSQGGRDFAVVLAELTGLAVSPPRGGWQSAGVAANDRPDRYSVAWRCLDAQYFGVPQRRNRIFLVGYLGDWRPAAAVLFEPESLRRDPPPRRKASARVADTLAARAGSSRGAGAADGMTIVPEDDRDVARCLTSHYGKGSDSEAINPLVVDVAHAVNTKAGNCQDATTETYVVQEAPDVAHTLRADGFDASEDGTGRGIPLVAEVDGVANTLNANHGNPQIEQNLIAVVFQQNQRDEVRLIGGDGQVAGALAVQRRDKQQNLVAQVPETLAFCAHSGLDQAIQRDVSPPLTAGSTLENIGSPPAVLAFSAKDDGRDVSEDVAPTMRANTHHESHANSGWHVAVAFQTSGYGGSVDDQAPTLMASNNRLSNQVSGVIEPQHAVVRRLTVRECERLQGFPDDYSLIPTDKRAKVEADYFEYLRRTYPDLTIDEAHRLAADGPRYKALGNAMAVPVMRWIGERIAWVEQLIEDGRASRES